MKKTWQLDGLIVVSFLLPAVLVCQFLFLFNASNTGEERAFTYEDSIPKIEINLNGVSIEEINSGEKTVKYSNNDLSLFYHNEASHYKNIEISGHGNSTWTQRKKPYSLKFEERVDLLGIGKAKKWVLLANFLDGTNIRNDIVYYLGGMLGGDYKTRGEFVELYIDNEYNGLYYLVQKIEIGKGLIDLRDPLGVLVELDNLHGLSESCYFAYDERCLLAKDLVKKDNLDLAMRDFLTSFNKLEIAAKNGDYETVFEVADVESLAKYYLVSEFTSNPDAYDTSWYFYKDGPLDKVHSDIYWDFDLALSNAAWGGSKFFLPDDIHTREKYVFGRDVYGREVEADNATSKLMYFLIKIPEFRELVNQIFTKKMSGRSGELLDWARSRSELIKEVRNKDAEFYEKGNPDLELDKLFEWAEKRYEHFEREYKS